MSLGDYGEDHLFMVLPRTTSVIRIRHLVSNCFTHETYQGGDQTLVSMLQHQQAMLQMLISQQESTSEKQRAMDQRILSIEENVYRVLSREFLVKWETCTCHKRSYGQLTCTFTQGGTSKLFLGTINIIVTFTFDHVFLFFFLFLFSFFLLSVLIFVHNNLCTSIMHWTHR